VWLHVSSFSGDGVSGGVAGFLVDDVDARHAELVAKQVVIDLEPTDQTWGTREMYVRFERAGQPLVGYWIGRNYWGKGIATRALSEFLGQVAARPLNSRVAKHNVASIRVLEKCGFAVAGEDKASSGAGDDEVEELVMRLDAP
jgi:RimJ/RimL family protein N-acetyltransferase